jgi:hypothetical protein
MVSQRQPAPAPRHGLAHCQHEFFAELVTRHVSLRKPSTHEEHGCVEWFDYCKHPVDEEHRGGRA